MAVLFYGYGLPAADFPYYLKTNQQVIVARPPEYTVLTPPLPKPTIVVAKQTQPLPPPPPPPPPKPKKVMSIYFAFNSYYVPYKERAKLKELSKGKKYTLIGGADRIGPYRYNVWLSNKRALAVKFYMQKLGLDVVKTKGVGYTWCHTPPIPERKCRRVDIISNP